MLTFLSIKEDKRNNANGLNHNAKVKIETKHKQNFHPEYVGGKKMYPTQMYPINLQLNQDLHERTKIMHTSTVPTSLHVRPERVAAPLSRLESIHYASCHRYIPWKKKSQLEDVYVWGPRPSPSPDPNSLSLRLGSPPRSNNSASGRGNLNKVLDTTAFLEQLHPKKTVPHTCALKTGAFIPISRERAGADGWVAGVSHWRPVPTQPKHGNMWNWVTAEISSRAPGQSYLGGGTSAGSSGASLSACLKQGGRGTQFLLLLLQDSNKKYKENQF